MNDFDSIAFTDAAHQLHTSIITNYYSVSQASENLLWAFVFSKSHTLLVHNLSTQIITKKILSLKFINIYSLMACFNGKVQHALDNFAHS